MSKIRCENCGCKVSLIWGDDDIKWTGRCWTCLAIYMFVTKESLI